MSHIEQLRSVLAPEVSACLDDSDLNRFLTARQLDINKAKDMVNNWHTWYHAPLPNGISPKNILDEVQDRNEDVFRQFMPHSNVGEDVNGNPICKYTFLQHISVKDILTVCDPY